MSDEARKKIVVEKEEVQVDMRKSEEWMKEKKYQVLGRLVDLTYGLFITPDTNEIAEDLEINKRMMRKCMNELRQENLIQDGERNSIRVMGYYACRMGYHVCDFCAEEMKFTKEWVTKRDYISRKFSCPKCGASAVFKIKGKREDAGSK